MDVNVKKVPREILVLLQEIILSLSLSLPPSLSPSLIPFSLRQHFLLSPNNGRL